MKIMIYATTLKKGHEHLAIVQQQKQMHYAAHVASRLKVVR